MVLRRGLKSGKRLPFICSAGLVFYFKRIQTFGGKCLGIVRFCKVVMNVYFSSQNSLYIVLVG